MELAIIFVIAILLGGFLYFGYKGSKNSKNNPTNQR
jgi:hypothetical protein